MKKEELMKMEGMTDALADALVEATKDLVPRTRLNEVIAERDHAKEDHANVLKELGKLQKDVGSVDDLKDQIKKLQDDAKDVSKAHEKEINDLKISNAVDMALNSAKALNVKAVKALLNLDGAELDTDGSVKGLADQIKKLTEADDSKFMFGSSQAQFKGAKHGESGNEDGDHGVDTSKMTYSELASYMASHPDAQI